MVRTVYFLLLQKGQEYIYIKYPSYPGHPLFESLPSDRRYRTPRARTNRLKNWFYYRAVVALNLAGTN